MSISSLVLELWQFSFIRDWPEIRKSEIPPSEFCPISGDWGELWIPNLAQMSLIKCYWMLQNARVTAFTVSELLRENQQDGGGGGEGVMHIYSQTRVNVRFPSSKKVDFICFNESLLKVMKKVFCFILKPFLFWRYWHLCPDLFGQVGKRIDKWKQISKFMTSSNGKLIILIYMLPIFQEVKAIRQWN